MTILRMTIPRTTALLRRAAAAAALLVLVPPMLAACGSSSGASSSTTLAPSTTTLSVSAAKAQIRSVFEILFDLRNPAVAPKLAAVQDGSQLRQTFVKELASPLAKLASGARVLSIRLEHGASCQTEALPSPCAAVTYDVLSRSRTALLANSKGFAVYIASRWLVAKTTICTLLSLANNNVAPKGC